MKNILLVENDTINSMIMKAYLAADHNVDSVATGQDAIRQSLEKQYDIILMDINLGQGIDGLVTAKKIRENINYKLTPIVAVTAFAMEGDKEDFLKNGCTHYISKPFLKEELLQLIESMNLD